MHPEARGYHSFAFIRHPVGRALSSYRAARSEMAALLTDRNRTLLETRYADDPELYRAVSASGMLERLPEET